MDKIKYYYNNYSCIEKIKKAYLHDIYKEGNKVKHDKLAEEDYMITNRLNKELINNYPNHIEQLKKKIEIDNNQEENILKIYDSDSSCDSELHKESEKIDKLVNNVITDRNNNNVIMDSAYNKKEKNKNYIFTKKNKNYKKNDTEKINYLSNNLKYNKRKLKLKEIIENM